jgi:protein TonB
MPDRYIEKSFLYVLCISLLLHIGVFAALYLFPQSPPTPPKEPVFIDLQIPPVPKQVPVKIPPRQVIKDLSKLQKAGPKGNAVKPADLNINKHYYNPPKGPQTLPEAGKDKEDSAPRQAEHQRPLSESGTSVSSLLKPKKIPEYPRFQNDLSLKQAMSKKIEDQIKNKLNSQKKAAGFGGGDGVDLSLESFYRRFLDGASNRLVYPPQAKRLGLEGVGAGDVTFNRKGEVINITFIRSIGKDFDESVIDAINKTVTGPLPKAYKEDSTTLPFVYVFQLPPQERR